MMMMMMMSRLFRSPSYIHRIVNNVPDFVKHWRPKYSGRIFVPSFANGGRKQVTQIAKTRPESRQIEEFCGDRDSCPRATLLCSGYGRIGSESVKFHAFEDTSRKLLTNTGPIKSARSDTQRLLMKPESRASFHIGMYQSSLFSENGERLKCFRAKAVAVSRLGLRLPSGIDSSNPGFKIRVFVE